MIPSKIAVFFYCLFFLLGCSNQVVFENKEDSPISIEDITDGSWTLKYTNFPERRYSKLINYKDNLWVLGGENSEDSFNDIWRSDNGLNWTQETVSANWTKRSRHQAVNHGGRLWILGGIDASTFILNQGTQFNDVWSSVNGVNWSQETPSASWSVRYIHQAISHNGKLWVLGGRNHINYLNDVWSSEDGVNWTQKTQSASWEGRGGFQAISHNGRLWVLGGHEHGRYFNDIWSSEDGVDWTQETPSANWSNRAYFQVESHGGKLWVLGGTSLNDVWSSEDGINWTQETASANWNSSNLSVQAESYKGRLWVFIQTTGNRFNDLWSYE